MLLIYLTISSINLSYLLQNLIISYPGYDNLFTQGRFYPLLCNENPNACTQRARHAYSAATSLPHEQFPLESKPENDRELSPPLRASVAPSENRRLPPVPDIPR